MTDETRSSETIQNSSQTRSRNGGKLNLKKGQLSITIEQDDSSSSDVSDTNEFYVQDNCLTSKNQQLPYASKKLQLNKRNSRNPSRLTSDINLCRPRPLLNLKHADSSGNFKTYREKNSNIFGYTPYDTGAVRNDFTSMIESIPKQSSLLNSQVKIKDKTPTGRTDEEWFRTNIPDKKVSTFHLSRSSSTVH